MKAMRFDTMGESVKKKNEWVGGGEVVITKKKKVIAMSLYFCVKRGGEMERDHCCTLQNVHGKWIYGCGII